MKNNLLTKNQMEIIIKNWNELVLNANSKEKDKLLKLLNKKVKLKHYLQNKHLLECYKWIFKINKDLVEKGINSDYVRLNLKNLVDNEDDEQLFYLHDEYKVYQLQKFDLINDFNNDILISFSNDNKLIKALEVVIKMFKKK
ncbi:hypothetical protein [Mesomycoplasma lagogenitalium]|uniref:Uncharacterized protein n=1 Tax=Mesomycoplasma lagogenitalium TaxID=171286 RepID=A0ABY8LWK9_9BACT|nr:hypothetical protein [Mesomycoplasma lagogenitalium]WGI36507.1 hypothetical protein QEG99_03515 [Mesomycoplasma lagogenitalium]